VSARNILSLSPFAKPKWLCESVISAEKLYREELYLDCPVNEGENIIEKTSYIFQLVAHERRLSTSASRTMAAMSLGFIVMVTPWTIQEVVAACTGSKPPPFLDFLATWLALSNSFWNPFLYWLLNNHFRRISREILYTKVSINVYILN